MADAEFGSSSAPKRRRFNAERGALDTDIVQRAFGVGADGAGGGGGGGGARCTPRVEGGRLVLNPTAPPKEWVFVARELTELLMEHQQVGVMFVWDHLAKVCVGVVGVGGGVRPCCARTHERAARAAAGAGRRVRPRGLHGPRQDAADDHRAVHDVHGAGGGRAGEDDRRGAARRFRARDEAHEDSRARAHDGRAQLVLRVREVLEAAE